MKTTTSRTSVLILILFSVCAISATAQTVSNAAGQSCTIKGRVTLKGQPIAGISIGARVVKPGVERAPGYHSQSDHDGNYVITNIPAGEYQVSPEAPEFWAADANREKTLILSNGETAESIDFALTPGGVITGKVTSAGNKPLIAQEVNLVSSDTQAEPRTFHTSVQTDDRGIYRAFGLRPGKYYLSVTRFQSPLWRTRFNRTLFPSVTDTEKALPVEVTEGGEVKGIDITVEMYEDTEGRFSVTGKVIDSSNSQPVSDMRLQVMRLSGGNRQGFEGATSDTDGNFKLREMMPGKYEIFGYTPGSPLRAERVEFEVTDRDVTGLVVKVTRKATVSGLVALETADPRTTLAKFGPLYLNAFVKNESSGSFGESARVNSAAGFQMFGLPPGLATFSVGAIEDRGLPTGLSVSRVERDGVIQSRGLEIKEGESISGVRVVLKYSNGIIRGVVKLDSGSFTAKMVPQVTIQNSEREQNTQQINPIVDARGFFIVEGLSNGTYEITARIFVTGVSSGATQTKQTVTVSEGSVTEVLLTVKSPINP